MGKLTDWVDPFIGVDGLGNCLPGPYLPLGQVRLGPDTVAPHTTSGYCSDKPILRFSHTHVSGTGGTARYGNFAITPFVGKPRLLKQPPFWAPDPAQAKFEINPETECAMPGYYALTYKRSGITVELTTTPRVGIIVNARANACGLKTSSDQVRLCR